MLSCSSWIKAHVGDNGADIMIKALSRQKFEAYCEISGLRVTFI